MASCRGLQIENIVVEASLMFVVFKLGVGEEPSATFGTWAAWTLLLNIKVVEVVGAHVGGCQLQSTLHKCYIYKH